MLTFLLVLPSISCHQFLAGQVFCVAASVVFCVVSVEEPLSSLPPHEIMVRLKNVDRKMKINFFHISTNYKSIILLFAVLGVRRIERYGSTLHDISNYTISKFTYISDQNDLENIYC